MSGVVVLKKHIVSVGSKPGLGGKGAQEDINVQIDQVNPVEV